MTPSVVTLRAINIGPGHETADYDVSSARVEITNEWCFCRSVGRAKEQILKTLTNKNTKQTLCFSFVPL